MALDLLGVALAEGAAVAVDSAPIIYFLEDHARFAPRYAAPFEAAARGMCSIVVSTVTLADIVAGPLRAGSEVLAAQYHRALRSARGWRISALSEDIAVLAARVRSSRGARAERAHR